MLKLKLQYFGYLIQRADSLEKSLMLGKIEGRSRRGHQKMRWLDSTTNAMEMNLGKLREMVRTGRYGVLQSMGSQRVGPDWVTEQHKKNGFIALLGKGGHSGFIPSKLCVRTQGNMMRTFIVMIQGPAS